MKIQKRAGKEEFPLTDQTYYQSFNEMVGSPSFSKGNFYKQQSYLFANETLMKESHLQICIAAGS